MLKPASGRNRQTSAISGAGDVVLRERFLGGGCGGLPLLETIGCSRMATGTRQPGSFTTARRPADGKWFRMGWNEGTILSVLQYGSVAGLANWCRKRGRSQMPTHSRKNRA